jgi:threonine-phosphate decarboxylase
MSEGENVMRESPEDTAVQTENDCNIYRLAEDLGIQERKVIDFTASVNPLGVSKKVKAEIRKHLKYLHHYPDPEAKRLRKRLAQYHGVDPETIVCGNGSTELIYLTVKTLRPQRVLIPAPTFSGYELALLASNTMAKGNGIEFLSLRRENSFEIRPAEFIDCLRGEEHSSAGPSRSFDMAFLCNPNNPTGRLLRREGVREIAAAARALGSYLVVDEAFIDFSPDDSVTGDVADNPYLIVLRSMSNFHALAGLRLGYGVFPLHFAGKIREYKEPWTVNSLAQRAAVTALKDKAYREETFRLLRQEKFFLEKFFRKSGIEFIPSDANFYLLKMNNAHEICLDLQRKGILVRDSSGFRGLDGAYLRIAVKSHRENTIFIRELAEILHQGR